MKKFLIILFSPAFLFLLYDIIFYWLWVPFGEYSDEIIFLLSFFSFVNYILLIWIIRSVCILNIKDIYIARDSQKGLSFIVCIALIVIGILSLHMQLDGDFSFDFESRYSEIASKNIFFIVIIQVITYILIFDLYISNKSLKYFICTSFFIMSTSFLGGRSGVLILSIFIFFMAVMRFNIKWIYLIFIFSILIIFFVGASFLRGTLYMDDGLAFSYLDFNQIFTLVEVLKYSDIHGMQFEKFLGDVINGFLPKSLNPEKMPSTAFTREVFTSVSELTSYTSGFYANLIFVFGYIGILIAPFLLFLLNKIYLNSINGVKNSTKFLALCFCLFPMLIVRGGIFEFRIVFALFLIFVSIICHDIIKKFSVSLPKN